jgi:hypothetical protein
MPVETIPIANAGVGYAGEPQMFSAPSLYPQYWSATDQNTGNPGSPLAVQEFAVSQQGSQPFLAGSSTSSWLYHLWNTYQSELTPKAFVVVEEPSRSMLKRAGVEAGELDLTDEDQKLAIEAESILGYRPLGQSLQAPSMLCRALAKLEIEILDQASVNAYKAQMAEHYRTTNKMLAPTWRITPLEKYTEEVPKFALRKAVEIKRELPQAMFYIDQLAVDPFLIVTLKELPDYPANVERGLDPETAAYIEAWSEPKFEATM